MTLEVVEHVGDLLAFLEALARLVLPSGILLIGTLNRTLRSYLKAIVGMEYVLGWLPRARMTGASSHARGARSRP
jgi:2-polyprenyl-6-hydroxyphenyl methylase / 3-demethylubiquinone-9 3-methyltransferase